MPLFNPEAGVSGGGSSKPRLTMVDNADHLTDMNSNTAATGTITPSSSGASISRGTTATGAGIILKQAPQYITPLYDLNPIFVATVDDGQFTAGQTYEVYIVTDYALGATDAVPPPLFYKFMGFRIKNNAGSAEIYAIHQDGTNAQVSTAISGFSFGQNTHTLAAVMTSASKIEYYADSVLVATHTTNLPSGTQQGNAAYQVAAIGKTGTTDQAMVTVRMLSLSYDVGA